jgi:CRISPR/Cas system-associated exonuclease Cas4 (RecB family)
VQYKFGELLRLPEKGSAYQAFHNCVYRVFGEMELETQETGENASMSRARELLARVWDEEGPVGHFYEPVYRARAEQIVKNWQDMEGALSWRVRQKLSLSVSSGERIEVTADAVQQEVTGKIVVARHRFGRPHESHKGGKHLDLFSLYVAAARETWPERETSVVLYYLASGETVDVPVTEKVISNRTKKLEQRIEGARAGTYPPRPGPACKMCSWNLVCPASI